MHPPERRPPHYLRRHTGCGSLFVLHHGNNLDGALRLAQSDQDARAGFQPAAEPFGSRAFPRDGMHRSTQLTLPPPLPCIAAWQSRMPAGAGCNGISATCRLHSTRAVHQVSSKLQASSLRTVAASWQVQTCAAQVGFMGQPEEQQRHGPEQLIRPYPTGYKASLPIGTTVKRYECPHVDAPGNSLGHWPSLHYGTSPPVPPQSHV